MLCSRTFGMPGGSLALLWGATLAGTAWAAPPTCTNAAAGLTEDYSYVVGSADYDDPDGDVESGGTFQWLVNSAPFSSAPVVELLLLHLDGSLTGGGGETPLAPNGVAYDAGRWGSALALQPGGSVSFARNGNLDLNEGTIEMWVALRAAGDDPIYSSRNHYLFQYAAPNGDYIAIVQSGSSGVLYAGGTVSGEWQSAYDGSATMSYWPAYEWHHLVYTFSALANSMRFYVDGVLMADTNEDQYWPPSATGNDFLVGSNVWAEEAYYLLDEVRITDRVISDVEIAARAHRQAQPGDYEIWLGTSQLQNGDVIAFEFTPSDGTETGPPCVSIPVTFPGIPITDPDPPSTILPPNTSELALSVQSIVNTECRYALGTPLGFSSMTPFDTGGGTTQHQTLLTGVDTDANVVTRVYVRCAAYPDFLLDLQYRCLSQVNPSFPRTGNLWGSWTFIPQGMPYCSRIDLWLGAGFNPEQIRELRQLNPDIRVLTSINTVENGGLPEDYYLHDINGNRVEVWPGGYRLNVTKQYVAEYQARFAYQRILDSELMFDGCFFDNVMTTQSWQVNDIYGNPFLYDYNEDGIVDDPDELDAAWKVGVFHELNTFRALMPNALMTGHAMNIFEPGIDDIFNGVGIGFWTADVIEDKREFSQLWAMFEAWHTAALEPYATFVESSPPDQIAYGYDYSPWNNTPPATLEFARTYYPYVRFGLAFTLMQDGFFAHEFGDTWHGNDWWYDELDFDLGYPLGPAQFVELGTPGDNIIVNGGFEVAIAWPWSFWVDNGAGSLATVSRDTADAAEGSASARIDISAASGADWQIDFAQYDRSLTAETVYDVVFWAKSDVDRNITLSAQRGSPPWENFGLAVQVAINTQWQEYTVSFTANATTSESRIEFMLGETTGTVWLDDVRVYEQAAYVLRRDFTYGAAILNPMRQPMQIDMGSEYRRLTGSQAPMHEYIVDDGDAAFSTTGGWTQVTYDSGEWQAAGPFYHNWGEACYESGGAPSDVAQWNLTIPEADIYTITTWWPAAPSSNTWSGSVLYEVVAQGAVVASATLDQRTGGDEWHLIVDVALAPGDSAFVRVSSEDGAPCIADALHVRSAARYNDGSPASLVLLQPMDGIVLKRFAGDFDSDGDVDLNDFTQFELCFTGADGGPVGPGCEPGDFDRDDDIDCDDWNQFVQAWTEPSDPPVLAQCAPVIPTVSEWGIGVMTVLLLTAGTVVFRRGSRPPHRPQRQPKQSRPSLDGLCS